MYVDAGGEAVLRAEFPEVTAADVEEEWQDGWRSFHRPVVAGGIWIGPPWETRPAGMAAVVVDPGRAFGTGAHPTTRACIELLAGRERGSLLDAGSGSGVVAVAGVRLGFAPVVAVDVDPVAVEVTRENAALDEATVDARRMDLLSGSQPRTAVVVANVDLALVETLLDPSPARFRSRPASNRLLQSRFEVPVGAAAGL